MDLLDLVHSPPVAVSPEDSVMTAIDCSLPARVGAVAVVKANRLVGIFTERDVMLKVVHKGLDARKTTVGAVMTPNPQTASRDMSPRDALRLMLNKHIRHLPVVEDSGELVGMLSIRNVLQFMVEHLDQDLRFIEDYVGIARHA